MKKIKEDVNGKKRATPEEDLLLEGTSVIRDIEYKKAGGTKLMMNIYSCGSPGKPLPLVMYMHGGGWAIGDRTRYPRAVFLLENGFTLASIDYRLTDTATFSAQLEDCKAAVRFLRANREKYNLKTESIGVCGHSAGGHLASLLGTTGENSEFDRGDNLEFSSAVQAVCNFYGPGSIPGLIKSARLTGARDIVQVAEKLMGGPLEEKEEIAEKASPARYIHRNAAPFLIIHGDNDASVDISLSRSFHKALLEAGVESHLHIIKGGRHGGEEFLFPEVVKKTVSFFEKHIRQRRREKQ